MAARDEFPRQLAGAQREHAQRPPHAAVEVQQRVRDVARDLFHGKHVNVGSLAALRAVLAGDDRAAVEAALRLVGRGRQLVPRLEDAPLAVHAATEALRGLCPHARRVVLEVVIECRDALDAVTDPPPLALARRRFRDLDIGAVEARAGEDVAHVAGQPRVIVRDDVRVELALDFVDEVVGHAESPERQRDLSSGTASAPGAGDFDVPELAEIAQSIETAEFRQPRVVLSPAE